MTWMFWTVWNNCIFHVVKCRIKWILTRSHMGLRFHFIDPCYSTNVLECRRQLFMTLGVSARPPSPNFPSCPPLVPPLVPPLPDPSTLSEKDAREELLRIARTIIQWDDAYYGEDKPLASDEEVRCRHNHCINNNILLIHFLCRHY